MESMLNSRLKSILLNISKVYIAYRLPKSVIIAGYTQNSKA